MSRRKFLSTKTKTQISKAVTESDISEIIEKLPDLHACAGKNPSDGDIVDIFFDNGDTEIAKFHLKSDGVVKESFEILVGEHVGLFVNPVYWSENG